MCRHLAVFWDQQEVITFQNSYHGLHFKANRGTTQGILISPTPFNLMVDTVVRNWLALAVEDQLVDQEVLGLTVGRCLGLFYDNGNMVGLRNPEWIQGTLGVLIRLFRRYGLVANVENSKAITFQPGTLRSRMSEEAVGKDAWTEVRRAAIG